MRTKWATSRAVSLNENLNMKDCTKKKNNNKDTSTHLSQQRRSGRLKSTKGSMWAEFRGSFGSAAPRLPARLERRPAVRCSSCG